MFTPNDIAQIEARGLSLAEVERQIENFRNGFPSLPVVRAASVNDGVFRLNDEERAEAVKHYDDKGGNLRVVKFVPASGAATRMFKELFEYVNDDKRTEGIDRLIVNLSQPPTLSAPPLPCSHHHCFTPLACGLSSSPPRFPTSNFHPSPAHPLPGSPVFPSGSC